MACGTKFKTCAVFCLLALTNTATSAAPASSPPPLNTTTSTSRTTAAATTTTTTTSTTLTTPTPTAPPTAITCDKSVNTEIGCVVNNRGNCYWDVNNNVCKANVHVQWDGHGDPVNVDVRQELQNDIRCEQWHVELLCLSLHDRCTWNPFNYPDLPCQTTANTTVTTTSTTPPTTTSTTPPKKSSSTITDAYVHTQKTTTVETTTSEIPDHATVHIATTATYEFAVHSIIAVVCIVVGVLVGTRVFKKRRTNPHSNYPFPDDDNDRFALHSLDGSSSDDSTSKSRQAGSPTSSEDDDIALLPKSDVEKLFFGTTPTTHWPTSNSIPTTNSAAFSLFRDVPVAKSSTATEDLSGILYDDDDHALLPYNPGFGTVNAEVLAGCVKIEPKPLPFLNADDVVFYDQAVFAPLVGHSTINSGQPTTPHDIVSNMGGMPSPYAATSARLPPPPWVSTPSLPCAQLCTQFVPNMSQLQPSQIPMTEIIITRDTLKKEETNSVQTNIVTPVRRTPTTNEQVKPRSRIRKVGKYPEEVLLLKGQFRIAYCTSNKLTKEEGAELLKLSRAYMSKIRMQKTRAKIPSRKSLGIDKRIGSATNNKGNKPRKMQTASPPTPEGLSSTLLV